MRRELLVSVEDQQFATHSFRLMADGPQLRILSGRFPCLRSDRSSLRSLSCQEKLFPRPALEGDQLCAALGSHRALKTFPRPSA